MPKLIVTTRDGQAHALECTDGVSLMENIRAHGHHELLALCGGNCSCGTCHVHVDAAWFERLPRMNDDENGGISGSESLKPPDVGHLGVRVAETT